MGVVKPVEQGSAEVFRQTINDNFTNFELDINRQMSEFKTEVEQQVLGYKVELEEKFNELEQNLDEQITQIKGATVIIGEGPPSTNTVGVLGQSYLDTIGKRMYQCVNISGTTYTWRSGSGSSAVISKEPPENVQTGDVWYQII